MRKMKSRLLAASFLALGLSSISFSVTAEDGKNDLLVKTNDNLQSSRMLLGSLMGNPILHDIYLEKQLTSLTHPVDRALRNFFLSDPRLEQIYGALLANQDSFLLDFERYADVTMHRLSRGVTKTYDRLDHIVEETARDLGFSPEAIANRSIYIKDGSGSLNAFTVSGSQEKVIVVVHSTLLEKMDEFEVRAVLGHELGHIRASHPVNGMLLDTMFTMILRTYTQGNIAIPAPNEKGIVNFEKLCSDGKINTVDGQRVAFGMEHLDNMLGRTFGERRLNAFNSMVNGVVQVMMKMPEVERTQVLQRFMNFTLNSLRQMDVPQETIEFFSELSEKLPKAGLVKVDANQMKSELAVVADAISRAQESSADRFGSSVSKNSYLASSMGKLLGIDFTNENREGVLKSLLKQAENFYQNVSEQERAYYMGGSHPVPVLRTHMIMNFSPTPDIFFANPFISLLILDDGIVETIERLPKASSLFTFKPYSSKQDDLRKGLIQLQDEVEQKIVEHLMLTETRLRDGSRNPRFDNMLQFLLINKENLFEFSGQYAEAIKDLEAANQTEAVKRLKAEQAKLEIRRAEFGVAILKRVKDALAQLQTKPSLSETKKQDLATRQRQIDVALLPISSRSDLEAARSLRIELTALPEIRTKGSRIPIECRVFTY